MRIGLQDLKIIWKEFGIRWLVNRCLYSAKLKLLRWIPITEKIYEKNVDVRRIDIFEINIKPIEAFLNNLPEEKQKKIIARADMVLEGRIIGFSNLTLDYGKPINWQLNPLTGKTVDKNQKWYKISDFDTERGDIKVIWEMSRFSYLYFLLRAYMLTKNEKYYICYSELLDSWLRDNKYSYGANFKCGQECTLRMMNVLAVYSGFKAYGLTTEKDDENVKKIVKTSYKKVCSNFFYAYKCIKNDHTISEICGMIIGAWCIEDTKTIKTYFQKLEKEIREQFSPEGMYLSYSFNYQRYVMQLMEYMIKIQVMLGVEFGSDVRKRLYNAAILLYQSQNEDGRMPNYGANDGTLIFPVTTCEFEDYKPVINTMTCLMAGVNLYKPGDYQEEYLWFSNGERENSFQPIERKSLSCTKTGLYHYRYLQTYMMLNAHNYERRPGHMDQLHVDLWINGINVLCDTGTYSYADKQGEELSGTSGHNTVIICGREQMRKIGKFLIYAVPHIDVIKCDEKELDVQLISQNRYKHRRHIEFETNRVVIRDFVEQHEKQGSYRVLFHTPCKVSLKDRQVYLWDDAGNLICQLTGQGGEFVVRPAVASSFYMEKHEIVLIEFQCQSDESVVEIKTEE